MTESETELKRSVITLNTHVNMAYCYLCVERRRVYHL